MKLSSEIETENRRSVGEKDRKPGVRRTDVESVDRVTVGWSCSYTHTHTHTHTHTNTHTDLECNLGLFISE